jgi:serine/threonine-protein kinase HipA
LRSEIANYFETVPKDLLLIFVRNTMDAKEIIVFVYLPGEITAVPAGVFSHDSDSGVGNFIYGRRYLERTNAMAVDPISLPLGIDPAPVTTNGGLYGAFRDASPDYWGRLVIAAELNTAPETISETDFLLEGNATRTGNLDFRMSPDAPEPELAPPHFNQLSGILGAAEDIESGREAEPHIVHLLRQGSSMGGARPKCTVEWKKALWIAKFPSRGDTINIPRIEYATMKLAKACGVKIPEVQIIPVSGKDIYLIRRFDREETTGGWLRQGFISSLSLMRQDERDRLDWSYPAIAAAMRRHCLASDILQFFRRMVFNILVRNTDDHPRNHGFLTGKSGLHLSPAYDIVPNFVQHGVSTEFNLAMSVGERGREATIENALSLCGQFGLTRKNAQTTVNEMLSTLKTWRNHFAKNGVSKKEISLLEPSFCEGKL